MDNIHRFNEILLQHIVLPILLERYIF